MSSSQYWIPLELLDGADYHWVPELMRLGWDITRTAGGGDRFIVPGGSLIGEEGIDWFASKEHLFRFLRRPLHAAAPSSRDSESLGRVLNGDLAVRSASLTCSPVPFPSIPSSPSQSSPRKEDDALMPEVALTELAIGPMWRQLRGQGWKQVIDQKRGLVYISPCGQHEFNDLDDIKSFLVASPPQTSPEEAQVFDHDVVVQPEGEEAPPAQREQKKVQAYPQDKPPLYNLKCREVWPELKKLGWFYAPCNSLESDWQYIRPGAPKKHRLRNAHFFYSEQEVYDFIVAHKIDGRRLRGACDEIYPPTVPIEVTEKSRRRSHQEAKPGSEQSRQQSHKAQKKKAVTARRSHLAPEAQPEKDVSQEEPEEIALWELPVKKMWQELKSLGWKWKPATGLASYHYLRPGWEQVDNLIDGIHFFTEFDQVQSFVERHNIDGERLMGLIGEPYDASLTADDMLRRHVEPREARSRKLSSKAEEAAKLAAREARKAAVAKQKAATKKKQKQARIEKSTVATHQLEARGSEQDLWELPFGEMWRRLHDEMGWKWNFGTGLSNTLYFRPGAPLRKDGAILGVHYFDTEVAVTDFVRKHRIDGHSSTGHVDDRFGELQLWEQPVAQVWKILSGCGWRYDESGKRYTRPGVTEDNAHCAGVHYFESFSNIADFLRRYHIDGNSRTGRLGDLPCDQEFRSNSNPQEQSSRTPRLYECRDQPMRPKLERAGWKRRKNMYYRPGVLETMDINTLVQGIHYFDSLASAAHFVRDNQIDGVDRTGAIGDICYSSKLATPRATSTTLSQSPLLYEMPAANIVNALREVGWKWKRGTNALDDFLYYRPGTFDLKDEAVYGIHYFRNVDEVADFARKFRLDGVERVGHIDENYDNVYDADPTARLLNMDFFQVWEELRAMGWTYDKCNGRLRYLRPGAPNGDEAVHGTHFFYDNLEIVDFIRSRRIDGIHRKGAMSEDECSLSNKESLQVQAPARRRNEEPLQRQKPAPKRQRQEPKPTAVKDIPAEEEEDWGLLDLSYQELWNELKEIGWSWHRNPNRLGTTHVYARPGVEKGLKGCELGIHYFEELSDIREFIKKNNIDGVIRKGALTETLSSTSSQVDAEDDESSVESSAPEHDRNQALLKLPLNEILRQLQQHGWNVTKIGREMRYYRPGVNLDDDDVLANEDYFTSKVNVKDFIERWRVDLDERFGNINEEPFGSDDQNVNDRHQKRVAAQTSAQTKADEDEEEDVLVEEEAEVPLWEKTWMEVWDTLRRAGWDWKAAGKLSDYTYLRPNAPKLRQGAVLNQHYFEDPDEVVNYIRRHKIDGYMRTGRCEDAAPSSVPLHQESRPVHNGARQKDLETQPPPTLEKAAPEAQYTLSQEDESMDVNKDADRPQQSRRCTIRNLVGNVLSSSGEVASQNESSHAEITETQVEASIDKDTTNLLQSIPLEIDETQVEPRPDVDVDDQQSPNEEADDEAPPLTQAPVSRQDEVVVSDCDAESDQGEVAEEDENEDLQLPTFDFNDDDNDAYYRTYNALDEEILATFEEEEDDEEEQEEDPNKDQTDSHHDDARQSDDESAVVDSADSQQHFSQTSSAVIGKPISNDDGYNQWTAYAGVQINFGGAGSLSKPSLRKTSKRKLTDLSQTVEPTMTQDLVGADDDLEIDGGIESAVQRREGPSNIDESKEDAETVTARTFDKYYKGFGHLYFHVLRHMGWTHRTSKRLDSRGTVYLAPGVTDEINAVMGVDYFPNSNAVEAKVRLDPNVVLKLKEVKGAMDDEEEEAESSSAKCRSSKRPALDPSRLESGEWSVSCVSDVAREQKDASEAARRRAFGDIAPRASAYIIAESGRTKAARRRYHAALEENSDTVSRGAAKKRRSADARRERENAAIQAADDRAERLDTLALPVTEDALASVADERGATGLEAIFTEHHIDNDFETWRAQLMQGWSLLLQGFGSKRQLLESFSNDSLAEYGHVAVIDGARLDLDLRGELIELANILDLKLPSSGSAAYICDRGTALGVARRLVAAIEAKGAMRSDCDNGNQTASTTAATGDLYASSSRRLTPFRPGDILFVVVHSIDGPKLRNRMALSALAALRSKRVHLVVSSDHVNAAVLWDPPIVKAFNWIPVDATTFAWYDSEASLPLLATNASDKTKGSVTDISGLEHVLKSLTDRHLQVVQAVANGQKEANIRRSDAPFKAMTYQELKRSRSLQLVATTDIIVSFSLFYSVSSFFSQLREYLRELKDHNLVQFRHHLGTEYVSMEEVYIQPVLTYKRTKL